MIKSQGWYIFADGYKAWFHGLSAQEKKAEIRKHGEVIEFERYCENGKDRQNGRGSNG